MKFMTFLSLAALFLTGCATTYEAKRNSIADEGTIVFTRDSDYAIFGTRSPHDTIEVVYERLQANDAGQPVIEIGLRYTGFTGFTSWSKTSPKNVALIAQCHFFEGPNRSGPIVYSTPRQPILFKLGEITPYKASAPVKNAQSYQLVIGK